MPPAAVDFFTIKSVATFQVLKPFERNLWLLLGGTLLLFTVMLWVFEGRVNQGFPKDNARVNRVQEVIQVRL